MSLCEWAFASRLTRYQTEANKPNRIKMTNEGITNAISIDLFSFGQQADLIYKYG